MIVTVAPRQGRSLDTAAFTDLTGGKECVGAGWDDDGNPWAQFAVNLSAAEYAAVVHRLTTYTGVEETLHTRAVAADADLAAFEALAAPTAAQTVAVVRLLCRVVRALARLQLHRLDATD